MWATHLFFGKEFSMIGRHMILKFVDACGNQEFATINIYMLNLWRTQW